MVMLAEGAFAVRAGDREIVDVAAGWERAACA